MAKKLSMSTAAKPAGIQRKATREKKQRSVTSRRSSQRSQPALQLDESNAANETVPDLEDFQEDHSVVERSRPFVYLRARTRKIPQDKITSEWKALTVPSQDKVRDILMIAKRSMVNALRGGKRAQQADEAVEALMERLLQRLPRMPFPPRTKELNFDLDKLLEQSRCLENEMTAALHSVDLLKAELAKEDEGLDQDQRQLEELQTNSRKEMGFWKRQARKKHPLVELPEMDSEIDDSAEQIGALFENSDGRIFEAADGENKPLVRQLRNHLDSIRSNSMQVEGIPDAIREGSIWLESVMHQSQREQ